MTIFRIDDDNFEFDIQHAVFDLPLSDQQLRDKVRAVETSRLIDEKISKSWLKFFIDETAAIIFCKNEDPETVNLALEFELENLKVCGNYGVN